MKDDEIIDLWVDCYCCETDIDAIKFARALEQRVQLDKKETEALKRLSLSMMSAISLLKHSNYSGGASSDKMFNQMLDDYQKNLDRAMQVLTDV